MEYKACKNKEKNTEQDPSVIEDQVWQKNEV